MGELQPKYATYSSSVLCSGFQEAPSSALDPQLRTLFPLGNHLQYNQKGIGMFMQ